MTTEHTNLEHSDVEEASAEQQPVSETLPNSDPALHRESTEVIEPPTDNQADSIHKASSPSEKHPAGQTEEDNQAQGSQSQQEATGSKGENNAFSFTEALPLVEGDVARPFTDFIEEFRQAEEARVVSHSTTQWSAFVAPPAGLSIGSEGELAAREPIVEPFAVEEPKDDTHPGGDGGAESAVGAGLAPALESAFQSSAPPEGESHQGDEQSVQASKSQEQPEEPSILKRLSGDASQQGPAIKSAAPERPVSPLLRPPSRLRIPRHGSTASRQREETSTVNRTDTKNESPSPEGREVTNPVWARSNNILQTPPEGEAPQTLPEPESHMRNERAPQAPQRGATEEQSRPARRYRFDRPSASSTSNTSTPAQPRSEEGIDTTSHAHSTDVKESKHAKTPAKEGNGHQGLKEETKGSQETQQQVSPKAPGAAQSQSSEQEHSTTNNPVSPTVPEAEAAPPITEPGTASQTTEVALEDLPPLEYADLQRANSRRRRRRRPGDSTSGDLKGAAQAMSPSVSRSPEPFASLEGKLREGEAKGSLHHAPTDLIPPANTGLTTKGHPQGAPLQPEPTIVPAQAPQSPAVPLISPPASSPRNLPSALPGNQYNIVSGYTVSQMNQGNEISGPFMSPEPSPARGSTPMRGSIAGHGRSARAEVQRPLMYPVRTGDPSLNQLANAVVQGIQAQTDRMVNELRRANQTPANISVSLPPFPSTERVGVFVDVANLLYSARTLRITIDFARLLDFLRGNRRLVRAQAYCPTSPHSSEDQMFLQAVKGLGYRITTKNYKTFSSGAKKADLDLDLCMDVVRLVDGRAVDCIVLVSGDSDFMPMLDYCSDHGVRVEVAAFDEAMSATLRQSCDLFINLAMLEEIRA